MVLTWVSSGSCTVHTQTKLGAFHLEKEFQGGYQRVKGKHVLSTGLVSKKCGPMGAQRSLLPCKVMPVWLLGVSSQCPTQLGGWNHGWFWEPGCSWLDNSEMKIPYTSGCGVSLARRCWQKQVAASRVAMEGGLGEFRRTGTWVPHKGGMLSGFK